MKKYEKKKVFVFGIDGASPDLVFGTWRKVLPNMHKIATRGISGETESTIPPISITAWSALFSGKDPSELGIFGYSKKTKNGGMELVTSNDVRAPRVWDIAGQKNKRSVVLYVPLTFPASKIRGAMVTDFLTPSADSNCAYPLSLKKEIENMPRSDIFFDVAVGLAGHKGMNPDELIRKTYLMTDMQLALAEKLLLKNQWDLFIAIMLGSDRLQHMFWHHFDETHRRYVKNSKYKNVLRDYYIYLDKRLGKMMSMLPPDTSIVLISDHGMIRQDGKININNWLMKENYLMLKKEYADEIASGKKMRFDTNMVDFTKTIAYGSGAYHARIFINKKLAGKKYKSIREEIAKKLGRISDDRGKPMATKIFSSEDIYENPNHPECPDLTVYFDNLRWASNPDFGAKGLYSWESAAGADSAGHSRNGLFAMAGPGIARRRAKNKVDARRIAPTILKLLDLKIPKKINVKPIF